MAAAPPGHTFPRQPPYSHCSQITHSSILPIPPFLLFSMPDTKRLSQIPQIPQIFADRAVKEWEEWALIRLILDIDGDGLDRWCNRCDDKRCNRCDKCDYGLLKRRGRRPRGCVKPRDEPTQEAIPGVNLPAVNRSASKTLVVTLSIPSILDVSNIGCIYMLNDVTASVFDAIASRKITCTPGIGTLRDASSRGFTQPRGLRPLRFSNP